PVEHPRTIEWNWIARTGSLAAHLTLLLLVVLQTKVAPYQPPLQSDISREQLNMLYLPPDVRKIAPNRPSAPPQQKIRIDPRVIRRLDSIDQNAINPVLGPRSPQPPKPDVSQPEAVAPAPNPQPAPTPPPAPRPQPQPRQPELLQPRDTTPETPGRGLLLPR